MIWIDATQNCSPTVPGCGAGAGVDRSRTTSSHSGVATLGLSVATLEGRLGTKVSAFRLKEHVLDEHALKRAARSLSWGSGITR